MTNRPILFNKEMVLAILDGRKTQTRRPLKIKGVKNLTEFGKSDIKGYDWMRRVSTNRWQVYRHENLLLQLPFKKGDRLYVRETWCTCKQMDGIKPSKLSPLEPVGYRADGNIRIAAALMIAAGKIRQSIHMPRWASRITLLVKDVRIERLQDITATDAMAEGLRENPLYDFAELWKSVYGDDGNESWGANPWVFVTEFKPVFQNIHDVEAAA